MSKYIGKIKEKKIQQWVALSDKDRLVMGYPITKVDFAKSIGITRQTLDKYIEQTVVPPEEGEYDSGAYLRGRSREADIALMLAVKAGNANAIKLYKQLTGEFIEKGELRHKFDAGFLTRQILDAERELDTERKGVDEVQGGPALLPDGVCEDTGQGEKEDS